MSGGAAQQRRLSHRKQTICWIGPGIWPGRYI